MSRELKFRRWSKIHKHMTYFDMHNLLYNYGNMTSTTQSSLLAIVPENIMQYTGLNDCSGNDIYEGDIVATGLESNYVRSIVRIGEAETEGSDDCYAEDYYGVYLEGSSGLLSELLHQRMYVIGNVHANPELLKPE